MAVSEAIVLSYRAEDIEKPAIRLGETCMWHVRRNNKNVAGREEMWFAVNRQFVLSVKYVDDLLIMVMVEWHRVALLNIPVGLCYMLAMHKATAISRKHLMEGQLGKLVSHWFGGVRLS